GDSHNNRITGNFIGTDPQGDRLGNGTVANFTDGIFLAQFGTPKGPSNNRIEGNAIAYNVAEGVTLGLDASDNSVGNSILSNSIYGNGTKPPTNLGIDLGEDGITPNDPGDGDVGPNNLQNYPVLQTPNSNGNGTFTVSGTLN